MKIECCVVLSVICVLVFVQNGVCQWYQGPSGGHGGQEFDLWTVSSGNQQLTGVRLLIDDGKILCIQVSYANGFSQKYGGHCDETGPRAGLVGQAFYGDWHGFGLGKAEYLIGISGKYGDSIDTLNFYTTRQNYSYGSGGSYSFGYSAPTGQRIVALFGRAGSRLDAIGVMYGLIPANPRVVVPPTRLDPKQIPKPSR